MADNLISNSDQINLKGTLLALIHGNVTHLKKRDNMRKMRVFAFKGVDTLVRERDSLGEEFEQMAVKYFDIAKGYCLNETELEDFRKLYEMKLKVDILQLIDEMSPLNLATLAA